ncbi:MAG: HAD-IIIA family hydrolase [Actinomycetota bacterium]|nr:HAD-IIIA family hydrolase [Actinomycetota bacterium]
MGAITSWDVVVPSTGRASLASLLDALERTVAASPGPAPARIIVVDDRADATGLLPGTPGRAVDVLPGRAAGPAAARNIGWRACGSEWIVFLDDDVVPGPNWAEQAAEDLGRAQGRGASGAPEAGRDAEVGGSQGRVVVPRPSDRRPTDWARTVIGLETARWATADMAYRRDVLEETGGFDERFPRAYREDAELGLRVTAAGYRIVRGARAVSHPIGSSDRWASLRRQSGNADDVLMWALHGRGWRVAAGAPKGRKLRHIALTAAGLAAVAGALSRRGGTARVAGTIWLAGTAELGWSRVAPGPRERDEIVTMAVTSVLLPAAATWHTLAGFMTLARKLGHPRISQGPAGRAGYPPNPRTVPEAVLFDRDGTLVVDVPYNGAPGRVVPMPGAGAALDRLRAAGVALGVVSNQSGVARGLVTIEQVHAVNHRIEELLGPLDVWVICPHGPEEGCGCRKPRPGMVLQAAVKLGVEPSRCAVVGDIGADVGAARAAGARSVLVPTPQTLPSEVARAGEVAPDLASAVDRLLGGPHERLDRE